MILVTGSTGFVGRHIVRKLVTKGEAVKCLVRNHSDLSVLNGLNVEICYGDVTSQRSLEAALDRVETVIHLVAIIRESRQATFEGINYTGTRNLVQAAKTSRVKRIIYMSNLGAGPNKHFPLLYSKWQGEEEVRKSGIDFTVFQPSIMFGKEDGFVTVLAGILRNLPFAPVIGSGRTKFQLISVDDIATCIAKALENKQTINRAIPLGGPEHLTFEEIMGMVIQTLKFRRLKLHIPASIMRPMVWTMQRVLPAFPLTSAQLAMLSRDNITDVDIVEKVFGFRPISLRERIKDILC